MIVNCGISLRTVGFACLVNKFSINTDDDIFLSDIGRVSPNYLDNYNKLFFNVGSHQEKYFLSAGINIPFFSFQNQLLTIKLQNHKY